MNTVSIYFFAGDFADALRRYEEGRQQIYQTHNEVVRLIYDLRAASFEVKIYSFVTPECREDRPINGLRIISLGAKSYAAEWLLKSAVENDDADAIVAHIANLELLRAVVAKKRSRAIAMLANSYNRKGIRPMLEKMRVVSLLNKARFELVSNHCIPATQQLADIGVKREKLIPWDIEHPFNPANQSPKSLAARRRFEAVYVGTISEAKGISDLIRALAALREKSVNVHCSLAGGGDIAAMEALGAKLGASDLISFKGLVGNNDVFKMMASADLVVVPSRTEYPEGFPLTMFEAIASRTPIVCSDHPMFYPVMKDGVNASVFRAGDYQAFAAAIKRTLTDTILYAALSANAPLTWASLKGPADWRTLIVKWLVEGRASPWLRDHMLAAMP